MGIGAIELFGVGGYTGPASVIATDFTNYGPADDGRIKPDFVAPGKDIYSATSVNDTAHVVQSGTSMSTPGVVGSLFLLQQYYKENNSNKFMKASTLKGLAIHTCDEAGSAVGPDAKFGWGVLNMQSVYNVLWNYGKEHFMEEATLSNGGAYNNKISTTGGMFRVTICWTDLPGIATAGNVKDDRVSKLVNDLDVRIIDSISNTAIASFPWKLDPTSPANAATKGDNIVDNVEQILVDNLPAGTYYVRVNHKGTMVNAQDFSIVMTGLKSATTQIQNKDLNKQIVLYPNPTKGEVGIELAENFATVQLTIKNIIGQKISSKKYENIDKVNTIIEGEKGIYFVQISTNDGRQTTIKVIKE